MLYPDLVDVPLELWGGYCPAIPRADLAPGAAGLCQDFMFPQGALRTRGGLQNFFAAGSPIPNNAAINGLKTYSRPDLAKRLLAWDSLGNLYKENPQGTLANIFSRPYAGLFYQSNTQFGREYQTLFNALGGFDIPRQYDDTNWDRVSQSGPGAAPQVGDENTVFTIAAGPGGLSEETSNIASLSQAGNVVTVTLAVAFGGNKAADTVVLAGTATAYDGTWSVSAVISPTVFQYVNPTAGLGPLGAGGTVASQLAIVTTTAAHNFVVGQLVRIAGAGVAGYNGTWPVRALGGATGFVVVVAATGLANSGAGTASAAGSISAGRHQLSVAFITRQGWITMAAVPGFWISAGNLRAVVANIPIGPANIVARLLMFTPAIISPATTGSFFALPNGSTQIFSSTMLINDNVTTTATVDFSDTVLQAGFSCNYLFSQIELGECAFTWGYNSRTLFLGERAHINNVVNMGFEGGFGPVGIAPAGIALGWTADTVNFAGGKAAIANGFNADYGDAWAIVGDGVTAIRGKITQSAYQDYLGVAVIKSATQYSVRARIAKAGGLVAGTLHINLQSTLGGFTTAGLAVTAAQAGANFIEFTAVLTAALPAPQTDLILQVYADGTPTNNGAFIVDSIQIYPTLNPFNYSTARFAHAFNPESIDAVTGQVQIRTNDGQQLRGGFPLRNNFYLAKDHYLCYVTDDGINEPASWPVNEVSATVGICGPNAWDTNEEWAVFAERSGVYICWGSDPAKISQEIQTDASGTGKIAWDSINWALGHTIWVRIDRGRKMILIGVPIGETLGPNYVFMLDYQWLENAQDIAGASLMTYSAFTGKFMAHGRGRRWSLWNIKANSMCFAERANGTSQPFYGSGAANGKIYQQLDCALQPTDDGAAIPWLYQGYGCPSSTEEQQYQIGPHRKMLGYLKWLMRGVGKVPLAIVTDQRGTVLRPITLSLFPTGDGERPADISGERFYMNLGTNAVAGNWMQAERWVMCVRKNASIPVRGMST